MTFSAIGAGQQTAEDSVNVAALEPGYDAYVTYVNGLYANTAAVHSRFPGARIVDLSVFLANVGTGGDFEPGDMTPQQAPTFVRWRLQAGVWRPVVYASISDEMPAIVAELAAAGIEWPGGYRRFSAHYTNVAHICGPGTCGAKVQCDASQWAGNVRSLTGLVDKSRLAADFFGPPPAPGQVTAGLAEVVGLAVSPAGGYWLVTAGGQVKAFGHAGPGVTLPTLAAPVVGVAARAQGGYWLAASDGGVFSEAGAPFEGSLAGSRLASPVVGAAARPQGDGVWLAGADGGVFALGAAPFKGSVGVKLAAPVVGIAATPGGQGYWLAAADGGIFSYGDAVFHGSTGGVKLARPVVGIAAHPGGGGYWLAAADGGVFCFGAAGFHGSLGGIHLAAPVTGIAASPTGNGYYLVAGDGGVFAFGDARFYGAA